MAVETIKTKNFDAVYAIKSVIMLALMVGVGYLPVIEPLSALGMRVLGIFLGVLFGWCFIGILMPSIFAMIAMVLFQVVTISQAMATGWGNNNTMLIFFCLMISAITTQSGVSRFIALYFVSRKWVLGRPWLFTMIFLVITYFISSFTSTVAAILVCWAIFYGVCDQVGYQKREAYPAYVIIAVVIVATFGLAMFPFKPVGILVFGVLKELSGIEVNYATYTAFTLTMGLLNTAMVVLLGKFIFRVDVSKLKSLDENAFKDMDMTLTKQQKAIIFFMLALIFLLLLPSLLPKDWLVYIVLKRLDAVGTAALIVGVMCLIRIDGEPIMNFSQVASRGMQWDVLFLTATVMPLSSAIGSKDSGIVQLLVNLLSPLLAGRSAFAFLTLVIIISVILTQFCVNNVVGAMLLPAFFPFAVELGITPLAIAALLTYSCHFALLTPSASPMAAVLHGNTEWCQTKDIYKYGTAIVLLSCVTCCIVGIPLCQIIL